jgi:site-specific DNA-adenine methylase
LSVKPLITYPNDRKNLCKAISGMLPKGRHTILSPFFGGGTVETSLAKDGHSIIGYIHYRRLYDFWNSTLIDPERLYKLAQHFYPIENEKIFHNFQEMQDIPDDSHMRAALFFVLNKSTKNGLVSCGKLVEEHSKLNELSLLNLKSFNQPNMEVREGDYVSALRQVNNKEDYVVCLPPPYKSDSALQSHPPPEIPVVDHEKLKKLLGEQKFWLVAYKYCEEVEALYSGYTKIYLDVSGRKTVDVKKAKDIIFTNIKGK